MCVVNTFLIVQIKQLILSFEAFNPLKKIDFGGGGGRGGGDSAVSR